MNKRRCVIFAVAYIGYMLTYASRLNLSMAKPMLTQMERLSLAQFAVMGSAFSAVYAVGRLINGALGDRVKPHVMISVGLALAGVSNLAFGALPSFAGMLLLWVVNAFAQSMLWSSILRIVVTVFPEDARKKTAAMVTSVASGTVVGILLASYLLNSIGVRMAFLVPGAFTLLAGGAAFLAFRRIPYSEARGEAHPRGVRGALDRDVLWLILPAMLHGTMKDNISLFMADYFVTQFGVNPAENPLYLLFIPVVGFLGRSLYTTVYRMLGRNEHRVSCAAFFLCLLLSLPLCAALRAPVVATVCLSGIYALVSLINTSVLSVFPVRYAPRGSMASVSGIMDFATYSGHALSSALYAVLIPALGYRSMYITWVVFSLTGALLLLWIQRRDKERYQDEACH